MNIRTKIDQILLSKELPGAEKDKDGIMVVINPLRILFLEL